MVMYNLEKRKENLSKQRYKEESNQNFRAEITITKIKKKKNNPYFMG